MSSQDINFKPFCIQCPSCNEYIYIEQLNCNIFRHGVLKKNGEQIDPHSSKEICDNLFNNNEIYGCGKPFIIKMINNDYKAIICDYI